MRKGAAIGIALSLALILVGQVAGVASAAESAAGPSAAIASPTHSSVITGDKATVTVLFDAGSGTEVTAAELYVDGELHDTVTVAPAASSGSCKLTWRCGQFAQGSHTLTARVYDSSGHSGAVDVVVRLQPAAGANGMRQLEVRIMAPVEGQEIAGRAQVRVTTDESRVRYVMLLIDDQFVALTNMPPFTYSLDTTRYSNGAHTLKATAFDLTDKANDSASVSIVINNPGGRTELRLPQTTAAPSAPATSAAAPAPIAQALASRPAVSPTPAPVPQGAAPSSSPAASAAAGASASSATAALALDLSGPVNPVGPSISTPKPLVVAALPPVAARATAAPAAPVAKAAVAAPRAPSASPPAPIVAAPAPKPADLVATAATAAAANTVSESALTVAATPAPSATRGALPPQAVQVVMAPPAPMEAPVAHIAPAVSTAAPAARAASSAAAGIESGSLMPTVAAPRASQPALAQVARAPSAPVVVMVIQPGRSDVILHAVAPGEQLATISARYQVPAPVIAHFNGLTANAALAAGQELRIPWESALVLNGEPVYTDVPLMNEGGISLAPFRAIIEHSGGVVHWIPDTRQVRALAFARDIRVTIGTRAAVVDAAPYTLETESRLARGRAMVPLGLFRDVLGFQVTLDRDSGRIYLAAK